MGFSSDLMIEEHNERMATDERYAADYAESMMIDAALEAAYFERELEEEKFQDFFDDYKISHDGHEETFVTKSVLIDDDIPF